MTRYRLTFKQIGGGDIESVDCRDLDAACERVEEFLEYGYELIAATSSYENNSPRDARRQVLDEVNYRLEHPDYADREEQAAGRARADQRSAYYSQVM